MDLAAVLDPSLIVARGFFELANLYILIKQKSLSLYRNVALWTFGKLLIMFSTRVNLLHILLFNGPDLLPSAPDKAKLLTKNFSGSSYLHDSDISLPVSLLERHNKLHNIFVTPKLVKKVKTNFDFSKASGLVFNLVVALENCGPEIS